MPLTRPRFSQFDTTISSVSDPVTVLNKSSTLANIDVGFIMNRNGGALANTAIFWNEGANTFALAFTTNSGEVPNANIAISTYANLQVNTLNATFVNATGNVSAAVYTGGVVNVSGFINTSANISAGGNVTVANLIVSTGAGRFNGPFNESTTIAGVYVGNLNLSPRVGFFNGTASQNWQIDNNFGSFRWYTPGVVRLSLDANGNLTVTGALIAGGGSGTAGQLLQSTGTGITWTAPTAGSQVSSGTSNVAVLSSGGNVVISIGGAIIANVGSSGLTVIGGISAGSITGNGAALTGLPAGYSNVQVATYLPTYTGTVGTSLINSTGNILATGLSIFGNTRIGSLATPGALHTIIGNVDVSGAGTEYFNIGGNVMAIQGSFGSINTSGNILAANINAGGVRQTTSASVPTIASVGDQWYDTSTDILFKYTYDGTNNFWVDISSVALNTNIATIQGTTLSITGNGTVGGNLTVSGFMVGKSTQALYADLAEKYSADSEYEPGIVLVFGGPQEVTQSTTSHDPAIAGVVSTNPAYLMNSGQSGVSVALTGRVPCWVRGPINKGDRVVSSDMLGIAERLDLSKYQPGCIIGKSLETIENDEVKLIEVVVGRI